MTMVGGGHVAQLDTPADVAAVIPRPVNAARGSRDGRPSMRVAVDGSQGGARCADLGGSGRADVMRAHCVRPGTALASSRVWDVCDVADENAEFADVPGIEVALRVLGGTPRRARGRPPADIDGRQLHPGRRLKRRSLAGSVTSGTPTLRRMGTTPTRAAPAVPGAATGVLLFASSQDEPRARRPTDVALALASLVLVIVCSVLSQIGRELDLELAELLESFPGLLEPLWRVTAWAPIGWALVLVVAALARGRRALARDLFASTGTSIALVLVVAAIVADEAGGVVTGIADLDGPPSFPPGALAVPTPLTATASPHLSPPFRHLRRVPVQRRGGCHCRRPAVGCARPSGRRVARRAPHDLAHCARPSRAGRCCRRTGAGGDAPRGRRAVRGSRRDRATRGQGLWPGCLGRAAALQRLAARVVPRH